MLRFYTVLLLRLLVPVFCVVFDAVDALSAYSGRPQALHTFWGDDTEDAICVSDTHLMCELSG